PRSPPLRATPAERARKRCGSCVSPSLQDERSVGVCLTGPPRRHPGGRSSELQDLRPPGAEARARELDPGSRPHLGGPDRDELEWPARIRVAVALGVCSVKALGEAGAESNRELERLPRVAEVGLALVGERSCVRERRDVRLNG